MALTQAAKPGIAYDMLDIIETDPYGRDGFREFIDLMRKVDVANNFPTADDLSTYAIGLIIRYGGGQLDGEDVEYIETAARVVYEFYGRKKKK